MALYLNIEVLQSQDQQSFTIADVTGAYSPNNTTGYGGGINPDIPNINSASLSILLPQTTSALVFNVFPTLPSINPVTVFTVLATDLNQPAGGNIPDGVYVITYTVGGTFNAQSFTYSVTKNATITSQTQCCIDTKLSNQTIGCDCDCSDSTPSASDLMVQLQGAILAAGCGKVNRANVIIAQVYDSCTNGGCATCNC